MRTLDKYRPEGESRNSAKIDWQDMPPRNACFISFRHGTEELTQQFIEQFHRGLSGEIEAQLGSGPGVFLDQERLRGGDFFDQVIARELCASACLLLIYTPSYFDFEHDYCAREYKAMVNLETIRLAQLHQAADRAHGLIVSV